MLPDAIKIVALFGGLILALALCVLWYAWTVKSRASQVVAGGARLEDVTTVVAEHDLRQADMIDSWAKQRGFVGCGVYRPVFGGKPLGLGHLWQHAGERVLASWSKPFQGTGTEFFTAFENGCWLATLSAARPMSTPSAPNIRRQCFPSQAPEVIYEQHMQAVAWLESHGWKRIEKGPDELKRLMWDDAAAFLASLPILRLCGFVLIPASIRVSPALNFNIRVNRPIWQESVWNRIERRMLGPWAAHEEGRP
jgi:hypothetical protein